MRDADAVQAVYAHVRQIEDRARQSWKAGDLDGALGVYAEGIALCEGHDHPELRNRRAGMLANRARALRQLDRHDEAAVAGAQAVEALRPLARQYPTALQAHFGRVLYEQYQPVRRTAGWHAAMRVLDDAIDELRTAADVAPGEGREWLAHALRWRGRQRHAHGGGDARADVAQALALFRALSADDAKFQRQVAETLRWQARLDLRRADEALREALETNRRLADDDPVRNLPDVASTLSALVDHHSTPRPRRAREHLDELIDVLRHLEELAPAQNDADLAAALLRRARRRLAASDEAALADVREARRRWEQVDAREPGRYATMVVETYRVESAILLRSDVDDALAVAERAVARARVLDPEQDGAMLWRIVATEDLVARQVVADGYEAAAAVLDELFDIRRRYQPSPGDRRRTSPSTPTVRAYDTSENRTDGSQGVMLDPALFGPLSCGLGMSEDLLVITDQRAAARRGLDAAARRMLRVDETGHEHPTDDAAEDTYTQHLYTPNYVSDAIDGHAGVRLFVDTKGEDIPPMASRWRRILQEELARAGVKQAHVIPEPQPADEYEI